MSIPETTSAEAFWRYAGGKCLFESRGEAWRDIKAWITALPPVVDTLHLPSVSEPFLAWPLTERISPTALIFTQARIFRQKNSTLSARK
jgi:hypothetical protein